MCGINQELLGTLEQQRKDLEKELHDEEEAARREHMEVRSTRHIYLYVYIHTHTHMHTYMYIHIYIYIERERERGPGGSEGREGAARRGDRPPRARRGAIL